MKIRTLFATALLLGGLACSSPATDPSAADSACPAQKFAAAAAAQATSAEITAADLRLHVGTLAADELAGRLTGTREALAAAAYIAAQLERAGWRPGGDDGSYLQTIGVRGVELAGTPRLAVVEAGPPSATSDAEQPAPPGAAATVPAWIAGDEALYGADFHYLRGPPVAAELDVVVADVTDAPLPPRADAALLLLGARRQQGEWLVRSGAPGGRGWGALLGAGRPTRNPMVGGAPELGHFDPDGGPVSLVVHGTLRERLASGAITKLLVDVPGGAEIPAANVVAILDGDDADPARAAQVIVLSAHYDHLGRFHGQTSGQPAGEPVDRIFNGADDDASGVAAVLELAAALGERARNGQPPARTLVALLATGEEMGLLGTEWYLDRPALPLAQTVFNLNFEMVGRPDDLAGGAGRLWLTGHATSNLGPAWAEAGLPIVADPRPEQRFHERSDNHAFVRRGVLGQTLSSYNLHDDYHTVRDETHRIDFAHLEAVTRAALSALQPLADGELDPQSVPASPDSR